MAVYLLLALHRVYGGRWRHTALRALAISMAYLVTLGAATVAVAVWALGGA